jgi:hypothetical protein
MTISMLLNKEEKHLNCASNSLWFDSLWFCLGLLKIRTKYTIICAWNTRWLSAIASNLKAAQSGKYNPSALVKIRGREKSSAPVCFDKHHTIHARQSISGCLYSLIGPDLEHIPHGTLSSALLHFCRPLHHVLREPDLICQTTLRIRR